jgi:3-mercaptopyruvate sulfurtransferase SseA
MSIDLRAAPQLRDLQVNLVDKHERSRKSHDVALAVRPALAAIGRKYGASLQAERVITHCGAGIAASSDALALTLLDKQVAVYDGSLAECTADPSLPMETGEQ